MVPSPPVPKTYLPTWEMTVGVPLSYGVAWRCAARTDTPRNITPSDEPMTTSVVRAFFHSGLRKAGTPFEIASTPVTAAPPDANACSTQYVSANELRIAAVD